MLKCSVAILLGLMGYQPGHCNYSRNYCGAARLSAITKIPEKLGLGLTFEKF